MNRSTARFLPGTAALAALVVALIMAACAHPAANHQAAAPDDPMLAGLEQAARWPRVDPTLQLSLGVRYLAGPDRLRGREFFAAAARRAPHDPRLMALAGLLTVASADQVPLIRRRDWVQGGLDELDRAVALGDPVARYFRAVVASQLPPMFDRDGQAREDLDWLEEHLHEFPAGLRRALIVARERLGPGAKATASVDALENRWPIFTDYTVDGIDGFRFGPRQTAHPVDGVLVVRGYDFSDFSFILHDAGVVAIDAGTSPDNARAALAVLRKHTDAPITHLVLTHAHWDHAGGASVFVDAGAEVIAHARFSANQRHLAGGGGRHPFFFGRHSQATIDVRVDRAVGAPQMLVVGSTQLELIPVGGGETDDALIVHLPERRVAFVGDCFMPYFGAPFVGEGSPQALLDTIAQLRQRGPRQLIHGHAPLTDLYRAEDLAVLQNALAELIETTLADLEQRKPLASTLARNLLPVSLRGSPGAVLPFLLWREHAIKRLHQSHDGYWHAGGAGMETVDARAMAASVDALARHQPRRFVALIDGALKRGDFALAWRLAEYAVLAHPMHPGLAQRRRAALAGLRARHQATDPFKFIIYSQWGDMPLPPLGQDATDE